MTPAENTAAMTVSPSLFLRARLLRFGLMLPTLALMLGQPGCGGDARVELAAADALDLAAGQLRVALEEYNAEINHADLSRRDAAIHAFVARLQADLHDEDALHLHTTAFTEALDALWADQRAEWQRYHNTLSNLEALGEIAAGLRRVSLATLTVSDEVRRYLGSLIQARRQAHTTQPGDDS